VAEVIELQAHAVLEILFEGDAADRDHGGCSSVE
jgi:hypothetical protein